jgi:cytochrome oxidase Cu insertion factor (SCO1/SenC/PrrC family)
VSFGRLLATIGALLLPSAAISGGAAGDPRVRVMESPPAIADFLLVNQDDREFRLSDLSGRNVTALVEETGSKPPEVVLISIDGERDTPAVMKRYLLNYSPSFIGLTGNPKDVRKIAAGFKAVFFKGLPYDDAGNYQVEHTSFVYLVDGEGKLRATFLDAPVEAMASTVRQLAAAPQ